MHVLSTPPAFILSQDQTLRGKCHRPKSVIHESDPVLSGAAHLDHRRRGDPVWTDLGVIRFGLLIDPLEMTGSFLACHSIRFSRFKLRQIPCITCGFTRRVPPNPFSAARRYITWSPLECQHRFETFFRLPFGSLSLADRSPTKRPPDLFGRRSMRRRRHI